MSESREPTSKVLFRVPNENGTAEVESLWAYDLGNDRYKIDNLPFFAYSVSLHDIVLAPLNSVEGMATFERVLSKSGNRTIRVIFNPPVSEGNESKALLDTLISLGVEYEGANPTYIVLNLPPAVDFDVVVQRLTAADVQWEHADPTYDELHPNAA
ncbi:MULTISPECIES: DUF4265 domain-containing protein [Methylomonas]|uniref:DUF4265 domain-containing protein n=1 Tax=Methylomonas koyamae TaxID=702114 RepID=A0A177NMS6_9GAMM|nr:DUF4265 domain-containing protein [Methylomonas koyamae]OAI19161.1 hypothetical protein A1355_04775 [Methylomonas koyamae]